MISLFSALCCQSALASNVLKVAVINNKPPFVYEKNHQLTGLSIDLWKKIASELNLKYQFIPIDVTYDDAVKLIADNKYDALVGPLSVTHKRVKMVDFSRPYFLNKIGIASHHKSNNFFNIVSSLLGSLVGFIIVILFSSLLLFSYLLWLAERGKNPTINQKFIKGYSYSIWVTVTSFLRDLIFEPVTIAGKSIIACWLLLSVIFMAAITAVATSSLTVAISDSKSKFGSTNDIANHVVAVEAGSINVTLADKHNAYVVQKSSLMSALNALMDDKVTGVMGDYYLIQYLIKENKFSGIRMSPLMITNDEYAFAFPKHSPLTQKIDSQITNQQDNGLSGLICEKYIGVAFKHSCEF
jgi:ABC-type amino acid transport substrate-binding protein